jgi:hypothetical protein
MTDLDFRRILSTPLQQGGRNAKEKKRKLMEIRTNRIEEAIGWAKGTEERITISGSGDREVYFVNPGNKRRERLGEFDLRPVVGEDRNPPTFGGIWVELTKIPAYADFEDFRAILVLIYRNAYFVDHVTDRMGRCRYAPRGEVDECIRLLEKRMNDATEGRFELPIYGVRGLLQFLDLLSWNEDVKYHHTPDGKAVFKDRKKEDGERKKEYYSFETGRVNTMLSCIKPPYLVNKVIKDIIDDENASKKIDVKHIFDVMQSLQISRGICPAGKKELLEWFPEYFVHDC